ncbi:MAG: hypothetical protein M3347_15930, partial [Armatimonadota bacterium]|nr:hypothetical protein [Armatimonadota bacterium]
ADAIERALTHFPRQNEEETIFYQHKTNFWKPPTPKQAGALRWFTEREDTREADEKALKEFVEFCRKGSFRID